MSYNVQIEELQKTVAALKARVDALEGKKAPAASVAASRSKKAR